MSFEQLIEKITDPYERKARLWPALLALSPAIVGMALVYGPKVSTVSNGLSLLVSCGALFLITNISREWGKRLEVRLFREWNGKPTTQLLRHRDSTLDSVTKQRYHAFLSGKLNVTFPTSAQEDLDPHAADEVYQSAVRWLLDRTRDTKQFSLLFKENVTYGFRRNALGLKPLGLFVAFASIVWVGVEHGVIARDGIHPNALVALPEVAAMSIAVPLMMLLAWLLFFTETTVRTAAYTYADTLLRACDNLTNTNG